MELFCHIWNEYCVLYIYITIELALVKGGMSMKKTRFIGVTILM